MSRQVLDEQIDVEWYQMLKQRRSFDKVGDGFGRKGLQDEEICHLLHGTGKTFHSQDSDYYHPRNRHKSYCLVYYEVRDAELVDDIVRFLRHPEFNTHAKRLGKVIRVAPQYIEYWEVGKQERTRVEW
ncbi:hypothetical protein H8E77_11870 [bacterium]|nr:hypothetical protein [bacterium]